jgi:hypothetical protein
MDYINISLHEHERKESTGTASSVSFMDVYLKRDTRLYGKRDDFNFAIVNFPPPDINMPAALAYGVYISKLTCCSCVKVHVFTFLVPCCDVRYYFRVRQCSIPLDCHLFCTGFYIFWPLYCRSIFNLPLWLPRWYHLTIALSVHLQFTVWLPLWYLLAIVLSAHLQFTALIAPFVFFGHCTVCPSSIYRFDCPLVSFGRSIVCPSSIYRFQYPFGIFWPLCCLSIFNLPFSIPLWYLLATLLSVHFQFTVFITPLVSFSHSIVCASSIYRFYYPFGIF